jgi:hypothetical protein
MEKIDALVNYNSAEAVRAQLLRDKIEIARAASIAAYQCVPAVIELISVLVSVLLVRTQNRSLFVWIPLALLSSIGSVIWLLANVRDATKI